MTTAPTTASSMSFATSTRLWSGGTVTGTFLLASLACTRTPCLVLVPPRRAEATLSLGSSVGPNVTTHRRSVF